MLKGVKLDLNEYTTRAGRGTISSGAGLGDESRESRGWSYIVSIEKGGEWSLGGGDRKGKVSGVTTGSQMAHGGLEVRFSEQ